jgi:hypothetical protein
MRILTCFFAGVASAALAAQGAPLVANGSFEATDLEAGVHVLPAGSIAIPAWRIVPASTGEEAALELLVHSPSLPAHDGITCVGLGAWFARAAALEQDVATEEGWSYRLLFRVGGDYTGDPRIKRMAVSVGDTVREVEFDVAGHHRMSMGWTETSVEFHATSTVTTLRFDPLTAGAGPLIDDVRILVLEPSPPSPPLPPLPPAAVAEVVDLGGPGCPGATPRLEASTPHLGGELRIDFHGCPFSNNVAWLGIGEPTPVSVGPGCTSWVDSSAGLVLFSFAATGLDGLASTTVVLPLLEELRGLRLTMQGAGQCWAGNFDFATSVSNGVVLTLGD